MKFVFLSLITLGLFISTQGVAKHHEEPPCNHESLADAWGEN